MKILLKRYNFILILRKKANNFKFKIAIFALVPIMIQKKQDNVYLFRNRIIVFYKGLVLGFWDTIKSSIELLDVFESNFYIDVN